MADTLCARPNLGAYAGLSSHESLFDDEIQHPDTRHPQAVTGTAPYHIQQPTYPDAVSNTCQDSPSNSPKHSNQRNQISQCGHDTDDYEQIRDFSNLPWWNAPKPQSSSSVLTEYSIRSRKSVASTDIVPAPARNPITTRDGCAQTQSMRNGCNSALSLVGNENAGYSTNRPCRALEKSPQSDFTFEAMRVRYHNMGPENEVFQQPQRQQQDEAGDEDEDEGNYKSEDEQEEKEQMKQSEEALMVPVKPPPKCGIDARSKSMAELRLQLADQQTRTDEHERAIDVLRQQQYDSGAPHRTLKETYATRNARLLTTGSQLFNSEHNNQRIGEAYAVAVPREQGLKSEIERQDDTIETIRRCVQNAIRHRKESNNKIEELELTLEQVRTEAKQENLTIHETYLDKIEALYSALELKDQIIEELRSHARIFRLQQKQMKEHIRYLDSTLETMVKERDRMRTTLFNRKIQLAGYKGRAIDIFHELAVLQITIRHNMGLDVLNLLRRYTHVSLKEAAGLDGWELDYVYQAHLRAVLKGAEVDTKESGSARLRHFVAMTFDNTSYTDKGRKSILPWWSRSIKGPQIIHGVQNEANIGDLGEERRLEMEKHNISEGKITDQQPIMATDSSFSFDIKLDDHIYGSHDSGPIKSDPEANECEDYDVESEVNDEHNSDLEDVPEPARVLTVRNWTYIDGIDSDSDSDDDSDSERKTPPDLLLPPTPPESVTSCGAADDDDTDVDDRNDPVLIPSRCGQIMNAPRTGIPDHSVSPTIERVNQAWEDCI